MIKKKAYFIGMAGKTMAPLAKAFQDMGWFVSGSDQEKVYPPITDYLAKNKLCFRRGYREENLPLDADLIVVGRSALMINRGNPEYFKAKSQGLTVLSYPEVLKKYLIKEKSIVVAGTYGKTTVSALVSWILIKAGLDPSYMIGGLPINMEDGVKITQSSFSVVEGDEPPALFPDDLPKFMFYKPQYLILTATIYDHPEVFASEDDYLSAFKDLVELLPSGGLLIHNFENVNLAVVDKTKCRKISYSFGNPKADYYLSQYSFGEKETTFEINKNKQKFLKTKTVLLGKANLENICAAVALCSSLGISAPVIDSAITSFQGIKTRLEFLGNFSGRIFYWDIAQHPQKVKGSLEALKDKYPRSRIICVFDPAMTGLKYQESLKWYPGTFDKASLVIIGKVRYLEKEKTKRVTGQEIAKAISKTQKNVIYQPISEKIFDYLAAETKSGDVIIFASSGGLDFTRLIERILDNFNK